MFGDELEGVPAEFFFFAAVAGDELGIALADAGVFEEAIEYPAYVDAHVGTGEICFAFCYHCSVLYCLFLARFDRNTRDGVLWGGGADAGHAVNTSLYARRSTPASLRPSVLHLLPHPTSPLASKQNGATNVLKNIIYLG